ncbi:MAG: LAGLIDADG family homing endonuclease [Nanoarchaeota archaeon]|nr:LAGLIDADG family homing endonuclease [Nanoarchaeota archaeon]
MPFDVIIGRNESDKKVFGERGLAFIGKSYVSMGNYTSLSNPIFLDVARSHVILISGKRGSGKCLSEDTLVNLSDGTQVPIKYLENNNQKIISLDKNLKIKTSRKTEFYSREVNRLLKIKLRSGREIKLTPEHPLLTVKGWRPVEELKKGSRIATPRILPYFGDLVLPEYEVKLLAYLIAEGHTKKIVLFSNYDKKIVDEFRCSLNEFDPKLNIVEEKKGCFRISCPNWKIKILNHNSERTQKGHFMKGNANIVEKRSIRKLIEREGLFGKLSIEKQIPENILKLKKAQLSIFLNRLFSCDGSIYQSNKYWEISYSSSSEKLITQVQNLLLRFGIISKLRNKNIKYKGCIFKSFELVLNSPNVLKFIEEIGFFGEKEKRIEKAVLDINSKIKNPNIDTIPKEFWDEFTPKSWVEIGRKMNYKYPKAMRERLRYAPSRQTLLRISEIEKNESLKLLATSDIFWDEIVSREILNGKFKVYDISVPEFHNFVANDIIVHNSYTIGTIAESLSDLGAEESANISSLIFDTMGIFWTMKYKNEKDGELLSDWGLEAKNVPVKVFAPFGYFQEYREKGVDVDDEFAIKISELEPGDWVSLFELRFTDPIAVVIESVVSELKERKKNFGFNEIYDLISKVINVNQDVKNSAIALFDAARAWKVFDEIKGTAVKDLISPGKTTVIDLSMYVSVGAFNVRALIIGLVSKKLFNERMIARKNEEIQEISHGINYGRNEIRREVPIVWIFIDEAHEFLPKDGKTPATDALVQVLREGRQPGLSLVLATQQPGKIHSDAITQSDIVISHRVTAKLDVEAINEITQSYLYENISQKLDNLPKLKGSAIILDDNSERIYPMRIRPRFTWHGGESPSAIKKETE